MSKNITFAGNHTLIGAVIQPVAKNDDRPKTDIKPLIHSLTITESMLNDCIRGTLEVIDMTGLLESYPLRGEERLKLKISDALGTKRQYDLFIFKVDDVKAVGSNKGLSYKIHFVSYQRFQAEKSRITRSFDLPIYGTVSRIFTDYYLGGEEAKTSFSRGRREVVEDQESKDILIEKTDGSFRCVIPSYTPMQAMRFLAQRSYSNESPSCSFHFFESADSFYFTTVEHLFAEAVKNERIFDMTHVEMLEKDNKNIHKQMDNLISVLNNRRFDTIEDIHSGAYRNKVLEVDLIHRTVNFDDEGFNYNDRKKDYFSILDGQKLIDRHSDEFMEETFTSENGRRFLLIKDYTNNVGGQLNGDQFTPQIVSNRTSYQNHLSSITLDATGYGRMDITCGDVIDLGVPEINSGKKIGNNKQLSGKYIVESLVRVFMHDEYHNHYRLKKKDWSEKIDNRVEHFLKTGLGGL